MVGFAMEMPTAFLGEWAPLAGLDFVLAHKVLEDKEYAEFFKNRSLYRELLLDNSYHELGYPLPIADLLEAATRCRANYVIAPDKVGDVRFNVEAYHAARSALAGYYIAVVMTGTPDGTPEERENFLHDVRDADMLCCTFKQPERFAWYKESPIAKRWKRVHLLGVSTKNELIEWASYAREHSEIVWSVDTGKALKWALRGEKLYDRASWRLDERATTLGHPSKESQKILELRKEDVSTAQEALLTYNVTYLKELLW